ncbi:metal-sensitive transcriptional regulator [uncultured Microbacterium sp.]|uniref:metal-sensitive transcriptional regulator n=1 Tax=uncultured Microbacterium sp. TaxID=191216 RepID=UPI002630EB66|nr:metal-sensitive transcriptional regulator [uncultured Microbacterium sp.]
MTIPTPAADGYITDPRTYRNRLRRLEGQLRGITRMIEQERPCIDTLTQISASKRALEGVALSLLDDHLRHANATGTLDDELTITAMSAAIGRLIQP